MTVHLSPFAMLVFKTMTVKYSQNLTLFVFLFFLLSYPLHSVRNTLFHTLLRNKCWEKIAVNEM